MNGIVFLIVILLIYFLTKSLSSSYQGLDAPRMGRWWEDLTIQPASMEGFQDEKKKSEAGHFPEYSETLNVPPSMAGPANLMNERPYLLLEDHTEQSADLIDQLSSERCYQTDFKQILEPVGNYRQMTNNFKRGHPDSCSAPRQEMVLSFYQADPVRIPA